jgi:Cupin-like domain
MSLTVLTELDAATFLHDHLGPGRPVLVRGALDDSPWAPPWDLSTLAERFGDRPVTLTGSEFSVTRITTLRKYIERYTGDHVTGEPPYARWFVRQYSGRRPWADAVFDQLAGDWSVPDWLPDRDYVFPPTTGVVDTARHAFPAKGLFICGRGGRTSMHSDPWATDACLCQLTGRKRLIMYPPGTNGVEVPGGTTIAEAGLDEIDDPRWGDVRPEIDAVLEPGDILFIPAGWYHTAVALDDSVSITWNFVHRTNSERFEAFLESGGSGDVTVRYFLGLDAEDAT